MRKPHEHVTPEAVQIIKEWKDGKDKKYGRSAINPTQPRWFVSYPYMIAIMAVLQVMTVIYGVKWFDFFGFTVSAGWLLLLPIMMYIFQIVSECYGWQYSRQLIWCNFLVNGISTLIVFIFKFIPFAAATHKDISLAYIVLMDNKWVACVTMWIGVFISDFVTSSLMCWSRFQWGGRFVFIRMIVLHLLSEAILLSGGFIVLPFRGYTMQETWHLSYDSLIARTIICIILLPVARYIIWYIQHRVEGVVVFDYKKNFNPFKFGIDPNDSVQFNANGWDKIEVGKIDVKKLAQAYTDEFFEDQEKQIKERIEQNNKQ
jgi:hypothetical protein